MYRFQAVTCCSRDNPGLLMIFVKFRQTIWTTAKTAISMCAEWVSHARAVLRLLTCVQESIRVSTDDEIDTFHFRRDLLSILKPAWPTAMILVMFSVVRSRSTSLWIAITSSSNFKPPVNEARVNNTVIVLTFWLSWTPTILWAMVPI